MQLNIIEKSGDKKTPHLAICHESQGGSANNRHISLLMKSGSVELTDELMKSIEKFGIQNFPEEIQKAMSMRNSKMLLENALKEAFADSEDEWLYVEDWKDNRVYFSTGDYKGWEMMVTDFTMTEDGVVTVGDTASPVVQITDYMLIDGKVKLSETAEDKLESGMYEIVSKAIDKADVQEKLVKSITEFKESLEKASSAISEGVDANKTKTVEKPLDIQDIMKSNEFQELFKAQLKAAQAPLKDQLEKANAKVAEAEEILKAAEQVQQKEFTEIVKSASFIAEDKTDAMVAFLMKSRKTEDHDLVMSVIKAAQDAIAVAQEEVTKTKDQFALSEVGKDGKVTPVEIDPEEFIKAKAANLYPKDKETK